MFNPVKWFAGFIVMQVIKNQLINVVCEHNCAVSRTSAGKLYADCSGRGLTSIPRGLGADLEILNISSNNLDVINKDDLSEYSHLKELIMQYYRPTNGTYPHEFLLPLKELEVLDISDSTSSFRRRDSPIFPSSITKLFANRIHHFGDHFSNLDNLQEISLVGNDLHELPATLNRSAPLTTIDMTGAVFYSFSVIDLGKMCLLRQFFLDGFHDPSYSLPREMIRLCCVVRKWFDEHNITSGLKCPFCVGGKYDPEKEAVDAYNECQQRHRKLQEAEPNDATQRPSNNIPQEPPNDTTQNPPNDIPQGPPNDTHQGLPNDSTQRPPNDNSPQKPHDGQQCLIPIIVLIIILIISCIVHIICFKYYWRKDERDAYTTTQKTVTKKEPDPVKDKDSSHQRPAALKTGRIQSTMTEVVK